MSEFNSSESFDFESFDMSFDVSDSGGAENYSVSDEPVVEQPANNDEPSEPTKLWVLGHEISPETNPEAWPVGLEITEANATLDKLQEAIQPKEDEIKAIAAEITAIREEMQKKIDALREKQGVLELEIREHRFDIRRQTSEVQRLERMFRQALDNERVKKEFIEQAEEFEKRVAGAPWREFALQHQIDGAKYMAAAKRCILADKMGLGKTLTAIATLDMLNAKRVLVIVPADVVNNFNDEIKRWAPHRTLVSLYKQPKAMRDYMLEMTKKMDQYIITINYEAWRKDSNLISTLISMHFDTVILDEAHTIKKFSTNAARGVRKIVLAENVCPRCSGTITENKKLVGEDGWSYHADVCNNCEWTSRDNDYEAYARCSVKNVFPMTGTPILNKPQDLFPMLNLLDPVGFYGERDFLYRYCIQNSYTLKWEFRPGGMESLVKNLSGKYIGRDRKSAGVVLPKQEILVHEIELDPADYPGQYKIVKEISEHAQILLESGTMNILATITLILRKRQANVWPAGIKIKDAKGDVVWSVGDEITESVKLDRLARYENGEWTGLIPELTADGNMELGERVVLFSQFKEPLAELELRLTAAGISVARFDGDTPEALRAEIKTDFNRTYCDQPGYEKKYQVILCNYKTGGVGLNFTSATQMIILDEEWNPGKRDQAYNRIDRIGQTEETTVHILRIPRTVDSWMAALIHEKEQMIGGFEAESSLAQAMLEALKNGDML